MINNIFIERLLFGSMMNMKNAFSMLKSISKSPCIFIIAVILTCAVGGCGSSDIDVKVKKETYYYKEDSTQRTLGRQYTEVYTNKNMTLMVPRYALEDRLFDHKEQIPFLITSKKPFDRIYLTYRSGGGETISKKAYIYSFDGSRYREINYWEKPRVAELPFVSGMNDVSLVCINEDSHQIIGVFYVDKYADRLIDQGLLPHESRQRYLDSQRKIDDKLIETKVIFMEKSNQLIRYYVDNVIDKWPIEVGVKANKDGCRVINFHSDNYGDGKIKQDVLTK